MPLTAAVGGGDHPRASHRCSTSRLWLPIIKEHARPVQIPAGIAISTTPVSLPPALEKHAG